jgi:hypothetical protein
VKCFSSCKADLNYRFLCCVILLETCIINGGTEHDLRIFLISKAVRWSDKQPFISPEIQEPHKHPRSFPA